MNHLILWNDTPYSQTLESQFGWNNIIKGNDDLIAASANWNKYNSLIVLCELNWSAKGREVLMQDLQGIELVKELRRTQNLTLPVLFVSFRSLTEIFNTEREILTAIGHDFYQLPAFPQDFSTFIEKEFSDNGSIRKLSVMDLDYIRSFYCSKEGILSSELHDFQNRYLNFKITEANREKTFSDFHEEIKRLHELFLVDASHSINSFQSLFPALDKANISEAVNYIIRIGNTLRNNYGSSEIGRDKATLPESFPWKVLWLDDEITEHHELVQCIKKNGVKVILAHSAAEAINFLNDDWINTNSIMVVIADYRLYEKQKGVKRHQKIQGYQFLKMIASSDHLVRLVAFSSLQRKFLLNSFKHYNIRTEVKSKTDYLANEETQEIFVDEIIRIAEENWEAIEALPSNSIAFKNSLHDAYHRFRMHPDYYKMENNVSLVATEYVRAIEEQIRKKEEIRIGAIDNITTPMSQPHKDMEAYFRRFQNYLVARRIALWLQAYNKKAGNEINNNIIAKILVDKKEYSSGSCRAIVNTNLGLSLTDFPKSITIEERRWLHYDMQLDIIRDVQFIDEMLLKVANIFQAFLKDEKEFQKNIVNNRLTAIIKYQREKSKTEIQESYVIQLAKNFLPILKTPSDARALFQLSLDFYKKEEGEEKSAKKILPLASKFRLALLPVGKFVSYQKNFFEYFNNELRKLNKEKTVLTNIGSQVKDKSELKNKANDAINQVFGRVYELCNSDSTPIATDLSDVFTVWCIAQEYVIEKLGKSILADKVKFFLELTKAINAQNKSLGDSFDEGFTPGNSLDEV